MQVVPEETFEREMRFLRVFLETENPTAVIDAYSMVTSAMEGKTQATCTKMLAMALQDCAEMMLAMPASALARLRSNIAQVEAPSIEYIINKFSKRVVRVLRRGKINTELEYYAIKGIADASAVGGEEFVLSQLLVEAYEAKFRRG